MNQYLILLLVLFLSACSKAPERTFDNSKAFVDLSKEVKGNWDRVCIITPYSNNQITKAVLGFKFDIESKSGIFSLDSITLLVIIQNSTVVNYFEVPRKNLDFSSLDSGCYFKANTKFKVLNRNGWFSVQHT